MTLIEQLTQKLKEVPLCISSTRRSGNGLRNADEVAAALMPIIAQKVETEGSFQTRVSP